MSWETQSWAAAQRPGSASAKLVLLGLASCADANHCAYPSIQWLCEFSDLNRKTVITALQRLEDDAHKLIEDTGQRKGRTNQVKVYRLAAQSFFRASSLRSDPITETVPKAERSQKRNSSVSSSKQSQKRDTEPFREPIPPSPSDEGEPPTDDEMTGEGKGKAPAAPVVEPKPERLPDGWTAPSVADLPETARKLVEQWPAGAYEAVCETFRLHWTAEHRARGRSRDWMSVLAKWLIKDHAKVMRDAKAGVSFSKLAKGKAGSAAPAVPVVEREIEGDSAAGLRLELRKGVGKQMSAQWFDPAALLVEGATVHVCVRSRFAADYIAAQFHQQILDAATRAGLSVDHVATTVSQAPHAPTAKNKKEPS